MTRHATSPFTLAPFEKVSAEESEGVGTAHFRITKTFTGDIEGTGRVEMLSASTPNGPAVYVAIERVTGRVHGRSGSFVFRHLGDATVSPPTLDLVIVPGSGTGDLQGITGRARIDIDAERKHTLELDYTLA